MPYLVNADEPFLDLTPYLKVLMNALGPPET